jgi:hypothetical protein
MMGWMAPLRHLGARLLADGESAANREPSMGQRDGGVCNVALLGAGVACAWP